MSEINRKIREKISSLPLSPGVYLMKDTRGLIIYVGKAKTLRNRVSSYFQKQQFNMKTSALVREITDFEVILTQTEVEALLLERTLIKHHKPRFNILLRDDKEYPFLRINFNESWPRIEKVRRRLDDGAQYLGPFGSAGNLRIMLVATYRIFPLIRCTRHEFATVSRPCNYYHMKLCLGPCKLPVDRDMYVATVKDAVAFLGGKNRDLVRQLREKMIGASDREDYELAASYRDQLKAFEKITEKQSVVVGEDIDADAIGFASDDQNASFHVVNIRDGKVTGSDSFNVDNAAHGNTEAITEFLLQYYDGRSAPPEVLLPEPIDDPSGLESVLGAKLLFPQRAVRRQLVDIALKNAQFNLGEATREFGKRETELEILRDRLKLPVFPRRMECIDISNFHETAIVASNVCFIDGKPAKEHYRHYTIETVTGGPDDFGSMREAVGRRLERATRDGDPPDLLVIDGGRGQLQAARDAAAKFPDLQITIVSLAKSRIEKNKSIGRAIDTGEPRRSFERVFIAPGEDPIPLTPGSSEFRLMTRIRDEAHRFAITHHRKRRSKALQGSTLENIPGIGTRMRQKLLVEFGGLEGLRRASLDQLVKIKGLRKTTAVALHAALKEQEDDKKGKN
jgi:excinuclease ABC subunit C